MCRPRRAPSYFGMTMGPEDGRMAVTFEVSHFTEFAVGTARSISSSSTPDSPAPMTTSRFSRPRSRSPAATSASRVHVRRPPGVHVVRFHHRRRYRGVAILFCLESGASYWDEDGGLFYLAELGHDALRERSRVRHVRRVIGRIE
jgi:hypothetical protein